MTMNIHYNCMDTHAFIKPDTYLMKKKTLTSKGKYLHD